MEVAPITAWVGWVNDARTLGPIHATQSALIFLFYGQEGEQSAAPIFSRPPVTVFPPSDPVGTVVERIAPLMAAAVLFGWPAAYSAAAPVT